MSFDGFDGVGGDVVLNANFAQAGLSFWEKGKEFSFFGAIDPRPFAHGSIKFYGLYIAFR